MGRKANTFIDAEGRKPKDRKLTRVGALTIVLLHPRIPQNTGSIARLCAATGSRLDIVRPLFKIDDTKLKRAGLDYWHLLDVRFFESWEEWVEKNPQATPWFIEVGGETLYSEASYKEGDFIVFGDEQDGIAPSIIEEYKSRILRLPQQGVRSINLSNAVSVVSYEALRQLNWLGLED